MNPNCKTDQSLYWDFRLQSHFWRLPLLKNLWSRIQLYRGLLLSEVQLCISSESWSDKIEVLNAKDVIRKIDCTVSYQERIIKDE
jgi:hypothetical protein